MDGSRFDEMTRRLSVAATRRRALGVFAGLFGGAVVAGEAAAGRGSVRRQVCRPTGVGCTRDTQCCSGMCETSRALPRNRRNRCACPEGLVGCGSQCVDTQTDVANCGACGEACDRSGEVCVSGVCESALDCTTYDGTFVESGGSWCMTTVEGDPVLSLACISFPSTPCSASSDCVDVATDPGAVAYCVTDVRFCMGRYNCKVNAPLGGPQCIPTQPLICPA